MSYYVARVQLTVEVDTPKGPKTRKTSESYLVEALSVTEAEAKVIKDFEGFTFDYEVKAVNLSKIAKILE